MLGSKQMASAYANPLKTRSSAPNRLAQWLQSASAEVWVKFLLALLGLGLAFGSALFWLLAWGINYGSVMAGANP